MKLEHTEKRVETYMKTHLDIYLSHETIIINQKFKLWKENCIVKL